MNDVQGNNDILDDWKDIIGDYFENIGKTLKTIKYLISVAEAARSYLCNLNFHFPFFSNHTELQWGNFYRL